MMRTAHIVPSKYLHVMERKNFHMALAHVILSDEKYRDFYENRRLSKVDYIILDNGAYEDQRVPFHKLYKLANTLQVNELVMPDVLGDKQKTLDVWLDAYQTVVDHHRKTRTRFPTHLMSVPQGKDIDEWIECAIRMVNVGLVDVLGVPKLLLEYEGPQSRINAITRLKEAIPREAFPQMHLLGCGKHPEEPAWAYNEHPDVVRSVDSSIAYVYTVNGLKITEGSRPKKTIDFENPADCDIQLLIENMNEWEEVCNCKPGDDVSGLDV